MAPTEAAYDTDRDEIDLKQTDGKIYAKLSDLDGWEKNPRNVMESDIERLQDEIRDREVDEHIDGSPGLFKPLLITYTGLVIGGNMRLRALEDMATDYEWVWVSPIDPENEDELVEYAFADNDRVGYYDEGQVADLVTGHDIDISEYKIDFYAPQDLAQNLAQEMSPEELEELANQSSDGASDGSDGDTNADDAAEGDTGGSDGSAPDRSMENLGEQTSTEMVQMFMSGDEKAAFQDRVDDLKEEYGCETTSDVAQEAVKREHARHFED